MRKSTAGSSTAPGGSSAPLCRGRASPWALTHQSQALLASSSPQDLFHSLPSHCKQHVLGAFPHPSHSTPASLLQSVARGRPSSLALPQLQWAGCSFHMLGALLLLWEVTFKGFQMLSGGHQAHLYPQEVLDSEGAICLPERNRLLDACHCTVLLDCPRCLPHGNWRAHLEVL